MARLVSLLGTLVLLLFVSSITFANPTTTKAPDLNQTLGSTVQKITDLGCSQNATKCAVFNAVCHQNECVCSLGYNWSNTSININGTLFREAQCVRVICTSTKKCKAWPESKCINYDSKVADKSCVCTYRLSNDGLTCSKWKYYFTAWWFWLIFGCVIILTCFGGIYSARNKPSALNLGNGVSYERSFK